MEQINLERVNNIITSYGLKTKARHRDIVWNRCAVYRFLRNAGFSFEKIGSLFGKNHATVINGLVTYALNEKYSDFKSHIKDIESDLLHTFEDYIEQTEDICVNEMISLVNLEALIINKLN